MILRNLLLLFLITFTAKLSAQDFDWLQTITADSGISVQKIQFTPENDVVVLGGARGLFHTEDKNSFKGYQNKWYSFITTYNQQGNHLWSYIPVCDSGCGITNFVIDNSGGFYVTGFFSGSMVFLSDTFSSSSTGFVAKLNSNLEVEWMRRIKNLSTFRMEIEVLENEGLLLWSSDATRQSKVEIESVTGFHEFVLEYDHNYGFIRYNTSGELVWAKFYGGHSSWYVHPYVRNSWKVGGDYMYVLAPFGEYFDVEPGIGKTVVQPKTPDSFSINTYLAKYDLNANLIWVKILQNDNFVTFRDVSFDIDKFDNIYITGRFFWVTDFDFSEKEHIITPDEKYGINLFVSKYDGDLNFKWVKPFFSERMIAGGLNDARIKVFDSTFYFYGLYHSMDLDPGEGVYKIGGGYGHFFAEYDLNGKLHTARVFGLEEEYRKFYKVIGQLDVDKHKNVYITGQIYGISDYKIDFDPSHDKAFANFPNNRGGAVLVRYARCKKPIEIVPVTSQEQCRYSISSLYALNDHFPVKWYNSAGVELNEGPAFKPPLFNHSEIITAVDGCGYTDTIRIERQNRWLQVNKVFPNPAFDYINISLEGVGDDKLNYNLTNALGQSIRSGSFAVSDGFQNFPLQLGNLKQGYYLLRIWNNCLSFSEKIIVIE